MASTETKVGLLVLAGLGALGWLSVNSGLMSGSVQPDMRALSSTFDNVDGLVAGADVKMAGVTVGKVANIKLTPAGGAEVYFTVKDGIPLSNMAQSLITSNGLIGEKFLEIQPGNGTPLPETATSITGGGTVAVENLADNFSKVADDLEAITASLRGALGGPENSQKLTNIVNSFEGFSGRLDQILNAEVKDGQVSNIMANLENATSSLNSMLSGNEGNTKEMIGNFSVAAKNLAAITERLNNGEGILGQMMASGNDMESEGAAFFTDLRAAAKELKDITTKVNSGNGMLARLVNDEEMGEELAQTLKSFSDTADRIDQFTTEVDLSYAGLMAESGVGKGKFDVTLRPTEDRYYVLGVTTDGFANEGDSTEGVNRYSNVNFGEQTKFTAQFGFVMPKEFNGEKVGLRIGMKDSTAGVGLDTKVPTPLDIAWLSDKIDLKADLYDFSGENTGDSDTPHLDLEAKVGVHFLGQTNTYAKVGYDNVLNQEYGSPFVGVGIRFKDEDLKYLVGTAL